MIPAAPVCQIRGAIVEVGERPEQFRVEAGELDIRRGDKIALVSPSGSGKSLFLEFVGLIRRPTSLVSFTISDQSGGMADIAQMWSSDAAKSLATIRRVAVGFLLQSGGLLPFLTVAENIALPARIAGRGRENGTRLIRELDLIGIMGRVPGKLSVGQRQRAALARAISTGPALLLADEPTAALDTRNADNVMALINEVVREGQVGAVVVATHDEDRARANGYQILTFETAARTDGGLARLRPSLLAV
jgi:putative ABC transport system ATP-binding protein